MRNTYSVVLLLNKILPYSISEIFNFISANIVVKSMNIGLNYIKFSRSYKFKRSVMDRARQIFVALETGVYGIKIPGIGRDEKY